MFTDNSSELSLCLGALHEYQPRESFEIEDGQKHKQDPPSNGHHGNVWQTISLDIPLKSRLRIAGKAGHDMQWL